MKNILTFIILCIFLLVNGNIHSQGFINYNGNTYKVEYTEDGLTKVISNTNDPLSHMTQVTDASVKPNLDSAYHMSDYNPLAENARKILSPYISKYVDDDIFLVIKFQINTNRDLLPKHVAFGYDKELNISIEAIVELEKYILENFILAYTIYKGYNVDRSKKFIGITISIPYYRIGS